MTDLKIKNPVQKLLALFLAVIIWVFAPSPDKNLTEVKFFVPVSYVNLPKNLSITSEPLQTISISVEIPRNELQQVHPSLFQAVIDLESAEPGEMEIEISRRFITSPENIKVLDIDPQSMTIVLEEIIEKRLPIRPVFVGEPAQGYVLKDIRMIPDSVRVRGLKSQLDKIEELPTKAINIDKINTDLEMLAHILLPKNVSPIEPKPEYYTIQITVGSEPINMRFLDIPIGIINHEYVTRINPRSFNVLLRGPRSKMERLRKEDIQAFIDLQGYTPGEYEVKSPTIRLAPEIQIQTTWPPIDIWVKNQKID